MLILLMIPHYGFVQSISELNARMSSAKSDQVRMECASELAWSWKDSDSDSSFKYANLALNLSRLLKDKKVESYSLADLGNFHKRREHYSEAKRLYLKSLKIRQSQNKEHDIGSIYNQLGLLFRQQELYDSAVVYFQKGLNILENFEDQSLKMKILDGYGMSLFHLEENQRALQFVSHSMQIANELSDTSSMARSHQNMGVIYEDIGSGKMALWHYQQSLKLFEHEENFNGVVGVQINIGSIHQLQGRDDLAIIDYREAEKISEKLGFEENLPTIYFNLGGIYLEDEPLKSIKYFLLASKNAKKNKKTLFFLESQMELLRCYLRLKKAPQAKLILKELENKKLIEKNHKLKHTFLELQIRYYRLVGNVEEAFTKSQILNRIQDSLYQQGIGSVESFSLLEKLISEEKITKEQIKRLKAEDEILKEQNKFNEIVSIFLAALVLILMILIYFIRKSQKSRLEKEKTIHDAKIREANLKVEIDQIVHGSEIKILEESLAVEKNTRESIGKDLHDQLGSKLAVVQILLESQEKDNKPSSKAENSKRAAKLIEESCVDLRSIAHNLVSEDMINSHLTNILKKLCLQFSSNTGLNVDFSSIGFIDEINLELRKNILAIVNLLMDNIIRHSKAKNVSVQLFHRDNELCLTIDDDGVGFELGEKYSGEGIGLKNALERVERFNGTIDVASRQKKGTSIIINLPRI